MGFNAKPVPHPLSSTLHLWGHILMSLGDHQRWRTEVERGILWSLEVRENLGHRSKNQELETVDP